MQHVSGADELIAQIHAFTDRTHARVVEAVDKTANDVANSAKAGHERGSGHAKGRYENRSNALTGSIFPQMTEVTDTVVEATVFAPMEYAEAVEKGTSRSKPYPFMEPALAENAETFQRRIADAVR